ncbi:MAG: carboxymuconolactone decarboxylase family protein [Steroidobacteraceae bacterium]
MRAAHERAMAARGDATFIDVAANAPHMFDWYARFYAEVFYGGRVPVRLKELVRLRLSTLHGCAFCNKGNRLDAARAGISEAQLRAIDDPTSAVWSEEERAVLDIAARMSLLQPGASLDAPLYGNLRRFLDDGQIFELGMTMAVLTGMAKFLFTFDLVEREEYCEFGA